MANAPTVKEATDATPGTAVIYGAPDIVHIAQLLKGTHSTELIQQAAIDGLVAALATKVIAAATTLVGTGFFLDDDTMAGNDDTKVVSQQSMIAYIAAQIAAALTSDVSLKGDYNASTNTPDLDTTPIAIVKGDHYVVSVAGVFFAANVEPGDSLIAKIDTPTVETDWIITQANLDAASVKTLYESNADTNEFSDAEQTAVGTIASKAPLASPTFTGTVAIPNYANVETTLDTIEVNRAPIASPTFTGIVQAPALTMTGLNFIRPNAESITASVTQTQGNGALTNVFNKVDTVANDNDTVTLPTAVAGLEIFVENRGANTLQIFPASGDDLGNGLNIATTLEVGASIKFFTYDTTNWLVESATQIFHGEMYDEDNTTEFVVTDAGTDKQSYHTAGLAGDKLTGWVVDLGGQGTSFPIASVADGTAGEIEVTTTGSHLLAAGDIISQSNCADANYNGIFVVQSVGSATQYKVTATWGATDTGTMDQAATLNVNDIAIGDYKVEYHITVTSATSNETIDFELIKNATTIPGTKSRRKFGTGGDFGSISGSAIVSIVSGDKISLALSNQDTAGNITIRNLSIVLVKL